MPRPRFSIGGLMGIVVAAAIGMAAVRSHSETWAGAILLLTVGGLALAVVGAAARRGSGRARWLGFALFGGAYLAIAVVGSAETTALLPTTRALGVLGERMGVPLVTRYIVSNGFCGRAVLGLDPAFERIGHCLWAWLAAAIGGPLAGRLFALAGENAPPIAIAEGPTAGDRRSAVMIAGLVAFILVGPVATPRAGAAAPLWASLTFAATCGLVGLAILAAILRRGPWRAAWLGAALFGAGYLALVFGPPADRPPRTPMVADPLRFILHGWAPADARILEALEQPVPMPFPDETPLAFLLDHIKRMTATPTRPGIPIYVDPVGLQDAERSMNSTVQIDLEGVPLRETLRLCLKQLGLTYEVRGGYLRITSEDDDRSPDLDDPLLVVGHCLLAMVAAGLGAFAGLIAAGTRGRSARPPAEPVG